MHPPKTDRPAADVEEGNEIYQSRPHRIRIESRRAIGGATLGQLRFTIQPSATNVAECLWEIRQQQRGLTGEFRQHGSRSVLSGARPGSQLKSACAICRRSHTLRFASWSRSLL